MLVSLKISSKIKSSSKPWRKVYHELIQTVQQILEEPSKVLYFQKHKDLGQLQKMSTKARAKEYQNEYIPG